MRFESGTPRKRNPPISLEELRPYVSVTLAVLPEDAGPEAVGDLLDGLEQALDLRDRSGPRKLLQRESSRRDGELEVGFLHYRETRSPGWTETEDVVDLLNQLVLVARRDRYVAVFFSDSRQAGSLFRRRDSPLPGLQRIPAGVLNAAFVHDATRTLWLSGIHTRTSVKPDSKILTGGDLRDALDPLGDQTYYFTAARCSSDLDGGRLTIGVSPGRSRAWVGITRNWSEFHAVVAALLRVVEETEREHRSEIAPIPILAAPLATRQDVQEAFDLSVAAPELLSEEQTDRDTYERLEKWAYQGGFEVISTDGPDFTAKALLDGEALGELVFTLDLSDPERVTWNIEATPRPDADELLHEILVICEKPRWVQIRFESGHTISDGTVYSIRYRDVRFENWRFVDLSRFDVRKEKPTRLQNGHQVFDPAAVGRQDSLFCWVSSIWPETSRRGWLACDDGAMEIADFVHLDDAGSRPVVSLIHVKGSHSSAAARGISVSDYERVTAQAIKNLRFLDRLILGVGLEVNMRNRIGSLVWRDGAAQASRDEMLAALDALGDAYGRRVVVLQPRVSQGEYEAARADQNDRVESGRVARLRQLDTLLVGAEASCRELGAELIVVSDGSS